MIYNPPEGKDYKWYISGIYCQLGDSITYHLLREPGSSIAPIEFRPFILILRSILWLVCFGIVCGSKYIFLGLEQALSTEQWLFRVHRR